MMRRTSTCCVLRLAIALAAAAALIGCGDDDATSDSAAPTAGATTTPAALTSTSAPTSLDTSVPVPTSAPSQTSAPAQTSALATSIATDAGTAVTYMSPQGDYSAVFPAEPTEQTQPTPLPDGSKMDMEIVAVEGDDLAVGTARGQYPTGTPLLDVPAALQGAQDQAIANVQGTLISSRDIELQGRPGREFSASLTSDGEAGSSSSGSISTDR